MSKSASLQDHLFHVAVYCADIFFLAMAAAMVVYPGGTFFEPHRKRFAFFANVFSDLGRMRTFTGESNRESVFFFVTGVVAAAVSMTCFFVSFSWCIDRGVSAHLGRAGALLGFASSCCFLGIACTPWDWYKDAHMHFVLWAFGCFLGAVLLDTLAVLFAPELPRRMLVAFCTFLLLLLGYVILLSRGIDHNPTGGVIHATGQKFIVFASLLTILFQSLVMRRYLASKKITPM